MLTVGLTGGIGSGKSEVARRFAALGAVIVDSDAIAREVVEPGSAGLAAIVESFGSRVLNGDGSLDREAMAAVVFADPEARGRLNAIVHPLIGHEVLTRIGAAGDVDPDAVVINDVPLLVEGNMADRYDAVVVVDVPVEVQLDRLTRLRKMTVEAAQSRIDAQASRGQRQAVATYLIDNSGPIESLAPQVESVWAALHDR